MTKKEEKKVTSEKPVKIPLDFKEAIRALLNTKPPQKKKKRVKSKTQK